MPVIITSPSTTRATLFVTILLFVLLQYIITSLIKFPPLGKTWVRMWWGTCKNICVEELSAGSQTEEMVKLVLIAKQSDLARAACDFAAAQNHPFCGLERGLAAEYFYFNSTCPCPRSPSAVLSIFLQICLPYFLKDPMDLKIPWLKTKIFNNCVTGASSVV